MNANSQVTDNLSKVLVKIRAATAAAGRRPGCVDLVAVSKTSSSVGYRSRDCRRTKGVWRKMIQEVFEKWLALKGKYPIPGFIITLQSNKARDAVCLCDVIETVDRPKLARSLARLMDRRATGLLA